MHASVELFVALTIILIRCWTSAAQSGRSCGNTSFTDPSGIIDPPRTLPSGMLCNYSITMDQNVSVSIKFLKFKLGFRNEYGSCSDNWLKIICPSDNSTVERPWGNKYFCGNINWSSALRISRCKTVILQVVNNNYWSNIESEVQIQYNTSAADDENDHLTVDCGETIFNDSTGIIIFPNNPTGYMARINCTYTLSPNRSSVFWFDVSSLNLTEIANSFLNCGTGNFWIQCMSEYWTYGARNYFSLCQPISGLSQTLMFSNCREAIISIRSEYFDFQENYRIPFKVVAIDDICGNTSLSASDGVITSPGFPLRYPRGVNCTYSIPAGNDSSVSLHFSTFEIASSGSSDPCYNDWLMITCSEPTEMNTYAGRRFCGELIWPTFVRFFNCSTLQLTFVSSRTSEDFYYSRSQLIRPGFNVSYTRETVNFVSDLPELDCGQTLILSTSEDIHLPYNRSIPLAKINCTYTISANSSSEFVFNNRSWNNYLGSSKDCSRHQLKVACVTMDSSNFTKARSFCGGSNLLFPNEYLRLSCDEVELSLQTISYHRNLWLKIPFLVFDCGMTSFSGPSGLIISPSRHAAYNSYSIDFRYVPCIYTIDVGENKTVSLNFLEFELEGHSWSSDQDFCHSEWLIIRCIGLTNETLTANFFTNRQLCGSKRLQTTLTGCNTILFEAVRNFRGYGSSRHNGFIIEYTTHEYSDHCGNTSFADLAGVITSPGYPKPYPHGLNCTYSISVGTNSAVSLEFTLFNLSADCNQDWLSISCHPNETMDVNQYKTTKMCGVRKVPFQTMLTSCLYLTLNFVTNSLYSKMGFRTLYKIKQGYEDSCGDKVFTNPTGIISSPNYPLSYPRGLNCTYTISVGLNSTIISLEFLFFDLYGSASLIDPWSDECSHDWLVISCPSNETEVTDRYANRKLCGLKEVPFATVFSGCPNVTITFTADSFVTKGGFVIEYKVKTTDKESCDDAPNSGYMQQTKSIYFQSHESCSYVIPIGQGNKTSIDLHWSYWSGSTSKDCDLYWVIFILANCESTEMADPFRYANRKLCSIKINPFSLNKILFSNCQYVTYFFFSADNSIYGNRETVSYRISRSDEGCRTISFTSPIGVISYAGHRSYGHTLCTYIVDTGNASSVLLTFLAFSVGQISGRLTPNFENYSCSTSWMTIRCSSDGDTIMHPSLGKRFCGYVAPQPILFRNCSILKLNFAITDSYYFHSWPPFRVHYLSIEQICGKELFFDSSGIISFRNYETSFNCSYSIVADDLSTFSLTVSSVANSTTTNTTCQEDWILVACIDGQMKYENKLSYKDCIVTNLRTQLVIFGCKTITIVFHSENNRSRAQYLVTYNVIKSHESVSPGQTTLMTFTESLGFHRFTSIRDFAEYKLLVSLTVILAVTIILLLSFLWLRRRSQTTGNSLVPKEADEFGDGTSSMSGSVTKPRGSGPTFGKLRRLRSHFHAETSYLPLKSLNSTDQEASVSVETLPPQKTDSCSDLQRVFMAEPSHSVKLLPRSQED